MTLSYVARAFGFPARCDGCSQTLRDGETVNQQGPGMADSPRCPQMPSTVPCPPCLYALLDGDTAERHDCDPTTVITVDGVQLLAGRERDCPCPGTHREEESPALQAARAKTRKLVGDE
ncbi:MULTISPECIES: hypothetical protein [unclassified Streptomyces]|uniref:hypothetical protein n=1 Tax=unclassified Streptomyces TaxID=2593676 RepID=UPI0007479AA0|nr:MULTISPECIES: hypothetical protein [unclassified Streptomyces]KUL49120.1 hypothetical protein ADL30_34345 [Streptomyces sp. NRRL S-1521]THC47207.1 hypothetical protein E7X58_29085 [Streptomyces sp. A1499]